MKIKLTEDDVTSVWLANAVIIDDKIWLGGSKLTGHGGRVAALRNAAARARKLAEKLGRMADRETALRRAAK